MQVCQEMLDRTKGEMGPINIYEVYADVCLPKRMTASGERLLQLLSGRPLPQSTPPSRPLQGLFLINLCKTPF
jgi:hypothetical protein